MRQAGRHDLILLVYQSANVAKGIFEAAAAGEVLTFVRKPTLKDVLAAMERCAARPRPDWVTGCVRGRNRVTRPRARPAAPLVIQARRWMDEDLRFLGWPAEGDVDLR